MQRVEAWLRRWKNTGTIDRLARAQDGDRHEIADLLVRSREGTPLVIVDIRFDLAHIMGPGDLASLWSKARVFGAPLAMLSDGTRRHWYRIDASLGPVPTDPTEMDATLAGAGQTR